MSPWEKFFVNRRGEGSFNRLISKMAYSGVVRIGNSSRVLELGGGKGTFSSLLYERYHPKIVFLTDYDQDQVNLARNYLVNKFGKIPDDLVLQQADASHLKYEDDSFDVVVARMILHHLGELKDIYSGLDEINRVLLPGGVFVYVEFAHKREIRKHLAELGFNVHFRKGLHSETVIAVKREQISVEAKTNKAI